MNEALNTSSFGKAACLPVSRRSQHGSRPELCGWGMCFLKFVSYSVLNVWVYVSSEWLITSCLRALDHIMLCVSVHW